MVCHYAHIPKCGGSSVERYCEKIGVKLGFINQFYLSQPQEIPWSVSSPQHIDSDSLSRIFSSDFFDFGFAITRNPYDRLLSAFKYQRNKEKKILNDLSLNDFVKNDLLCASSELGRYDNHFHPQVKFILPDLNYTFFKLEDGLNGLRNFINIKFLGTVAGNALRFSSRPKIDFINRSKAIQEKSDERIYFLDREALKIIDSVYNEDFNAFDYVKGCIPRTINIS